MTGAFEPAFAAYIAWLDAEMPNASAEAQGVSQLPNGEAYYDYQLFNYTTLPMTADDVHELLNFYIDHMVNHERLGYRVVGTFHRVGRKFGRDWDVTWFERDIESTP